MADVLVVGSGPTGIAAALAFARRGWMVTLVDAGQRPPQDGRAVAVLEPALRFLSEVGAGEALEAMGAPLAGIRIIDGTGALMRAPTVMFRARELGEPRFGLAFVTADLVAALLAVARETPGLAIVSGRAVGMDGDGTVRLDDGRALRATMVVAADGRASPLRESRRIRTRRWSYPQVAVTALLRHPEDHEDISTELHRSAGPFTLVPAGPGRSSLVWMVRPQEAERLAALPDADFAAEASEVSQGLLGPLTAEGGRGRYPLMGYLATSYVRGPLVLVGEAAHGFPPIGAQGLNLGLRDVETLVRTARDGLPGEDGLAAWNRERLGDAALRTAGVDLLNRSLFSGLLPLEAGRSLAFAALSALPPLKRMAMRVGFGLPPIALAGFQRAGNRS